MHGRFPIKIHNVQLDSQLHGIFVRELIVGRLLMLPNKWKKPIKAEAELD
jgi:hypothetical protein